MKTSKKTNLKQQVQEPEREYWIPVLIGLIIIGIILRFYHLDFNSLWLDEISTYRYASGTFETMWQMMATGTDYSPPLFFALEHFILQGFGVSEWTIRFLPAVFGVLTIPVMYLVGKEFWDDKNIGLVTAGLVTFSPFLIYYSQEARSYSLALLFVAAEFYFFLKTLKSEGTTDWLNWAVFGLFAGLAFWTHYYTLVFTGLLMVYLLVTGILSNDKRMGVNKQSVYISTGVLLLISLPLILALIPVFAQRTASSPTYGIQGVSIISETFTQMSGYAGYTTIIYLILCVFGIFIMYINTNNPEHNPKSHYPYSSLLLVWIMAGTFLISIFMSYHMPMIPRHLIFLTIPFTLGISMIFVGIRNIVPKNVPSKYLIWGLVVMFLLLATPFYINYYQSYSKEDWRGIATDLEKVTVPGDTVITVPDYIGGTLEYYYSPIRDQTTFVGATPAEKLDAIQHTANGTKYYVVTGDINAADSGGGAMDWLTHHTQMVHNYGNVFVLKGV